MRELSGLLSKRQNRNIKEETKLKQYEKWINQILNVVHKVPSYKSLHLETCFHPFRTKHKVLLKA
jgi:hypothetical protein